MIKPEQIAQLITVATDKQLANMVVALFNRQIEDEKQDNDAKHLNKLGFSAADAHSFTITAKWCIKHRNDKPFTLQGFQRDRLRQRLTIYRKQLAEIASDPNYKPLFKK